MAPRIERIAVFETSALLAVLTGFTDSYTHKPAALERLLMPTGRRAPLDRIVIPDHVFYELTGLLPCCFDGMKTRLAEAKAHSPEQLKKVIELYALASPRGDADNTGKQKSHIRALLHFIANHPDTLAETEAGKVYTGRVVADYRALSGNGNAEPDYCPTLADAMTQLGSDFSVENLRVHIGQLRMAGLMNEHEYHTRMDRMDETVLCQKQRFMLTKELLSKLKKNAQNPVKQAALPQLAGMQHARLIQHIEKQEKERKSTDDYLTMRFFLQHPKLLQLMLQDDAARSAQDNRAALVQRAFGPSRLLMEHYIFGGILPDSPEAMAVLAKTLGYTVPQARDPLIMRQELYDQGFLEIAPNVEQLSRMASALANAGIEAPVLQRFLRGIPEGQKRVQAEFRALAADKLRYERALSEGVSLGMIRWQDYWKIATASEGMQYDAGLKLYRNHASDVLVYPKNSAEDSMVYIAVDGVTTRDTLRQLDYKDCAIEDRVIHGKVRSYYVMSAAELLDRVQEGKISGRACPGLHAALESMLMHPVQRDAVAVRRKASEILGEPLLVQLEKDFANRHIRRLTLPKERDLFAAMHINTRITRKNLGEIATLEAAQNASARYPEADVWVINHDSDLFPSAAHHGDVQLEKGVVRQHSGLVPVVRELNAQARGNHRLHLVPTAPQFLDTLSKLLGVPTGKYDYVKANKIITQHRSNSWASTVAREIDAQRSSAGR